MTESKPLKTPSSSSAMWLPDKSLEKEYASVGRRANRAYYTRLLHSRICRPLTDSSVNEDQQKSSSVERISADYSSHCAQRRVVKGQLWKLEKRRVILTVSSTRPNRWMRALEWQIFCCHLVSWLWEDRRKDIHMIVIRSKERRCFILMARINVTARFNE